MESKHTPEQNQCHECDRLAGDAKPPNVDDIVGALMNEWEGMVTKLGNKLIDRAKRAGTDVLKQLKEK